MKLFSLLLTILVFQTSVFAQLLGEKNERLQQQKVLSEHVVSSVKSSLSEITGWVLRDNTKWINAKNIIPIADSKYLFPDKVLGQDNISEMEIRETQVDGKSNAVLVVKYLKPNYEFPTLKEGFSTAKVLDYYVFPVEKILQIIPDTLSAGIPHSINLAVTVSGRLEDYESKDIDLEINTAVQRFTASRFINPANLVLAVMPFSKDGKDHVKFKVIKTYPSEKLYQPYLSEEMSSQLFTHSYFECTRNTFANFFNSAAILAVSDKSVGDQPTDFNGFFIKGVRA
ncbi:MAG: hypothetical protein Q8908_10955, partial [Bacteroidota bacterium]|nr:hypothetical protein [Bacteroidota bacterium]